VSFRGHGRASANSSWPWYELELSYDEHEMTVKETSVDDERRTQRINMQLRELGEVERKKPMLPFVVHASFDGGTVTGFRLANISLMENAECGSVVQRTDE
jgi:hypothetical protein